MQEENKTKQELEDSRSIRKVSLFPVSKADHQLIETTKSKIDRIVLEDLVDFKEQHREELASNTIQMNLLKIKKQNKRKGS